jgi:ATP-binding cassette subfamily B protein
LIIYQTKIALIVGSFLFIFYSIATFVSDKRLNYNSFKISNANNNLVKVIQETIGSIKEIILMSRPSVYSNEFLKADSTLRIKSSENQFISIAPKYLVDSLGILIIAFLAFYFNLSGESNSSLITILGTFALAAQRLIPAFQTLYSAISKIRSYGQSVLDVINLIELPLSRKELNRTKDKYKMQEKIIFENVSFSYNNSKEKVLNNINLTILQGSCIGIKGSTGSGKSTLISLLIGLLPPTNGNIIIDGNYLYSKNEDLFLQKWRNSLAYVSQDSFLTDNTLLANIAFGCMTDDIDLDKVKQAASFANIDKFINSTKDGYLTFVGERGVRLSGGQKQRIAIARALYKDSEILILDEATSQLDKYTESRILNSIKNLKNIKTIIMIAHRENTFENCDYVYSLENNSLQ